MKFSKQALDELKKCKHVIDTEVSANKLDNLWVGLSPKNWFSKFDKSLHVSNLSEKSMNRKELLELIVSYRRNGKIVPSAVRELIISIYAWGGMRRDKNTGILAINTISAYEDVCSKLLNGMSSLSAFKDFYELQKSGSMKGVGPAYYTKLIFFLGDQSGLIMDQWTARSANLLLGKKIIKLIRNTSGYSVSGTNSVHNYKTYLEFILELKNTLGIETLPETEELIFSCSHSHPKVKKILGEDHFACSAWRKYVVENT